MGRSLFIRDRELVFSGISRGRVDVFSGGLVAFECLSKYEIRNRPLLGAYVLVSLLVIRLYMTSLFVAHLLQISVCLVQRSYYY
jgi:hypothetical protein